MDAGTTVIDKSKWGEGAWQSEPDRAEWRHAGFPCLAVRHPSAGHWCGYVGLPPGHALHSNEYNEADVEVHGGLTYGQACHGDVCHIPKPGESDDVWWLGFDCAHSGDLSPGHNRYFPDLHKHETYKTLAYVTEETNRLAQQLAAITNKETSMDLTQTESATPVPAVDEGVLKMGTMIQVHGLPFVLNGDVRVLGNVSNLLAVGIPPAPIDRDRTCYEKAKANGEPTFTLRAQDFTAPHAVDKWADENEPVLGQDHPKIVEARHIANAMRLWPERRQAD